MKEEDIELRMQQLIEATENRRAAEEQRLQAERGRIEAEIKRLHLEEHSARLLANISTDIKLVLESVSRYESSDHERMLVILLSVLGLVQVLAVRVCGGEVGEILDMIRSNSMKVQFGDNATVRNMVDGQQVNIKSPIAIIERLIKEQDTKTIESELDSLPEDMADVVVAALAGPLSAAKMIAIKIANKWRVTRDSR